MPYPWFAPKMQVFESGEVHDMCGEDVSFCLDAKEAHLKYGLPSCSSWNEKTRKSNDGSITILVYYIHTHFNVTVL